MSWRWCHHRHQPMRRRARTRARTRAWIYTYQVVTVVTSLFQLMFYASPISVTSHRTGLVYVRCPCRAGPFPGPTTRVHGGAWFSQGRWGWDGFTGVGLEWKGRREMIGPSVNGGGTCWPGMYRARMWTRIRLRARNQGRRMKGTAC